jgi:lincosamide nucleotidyltransferase A/C/D/E
MPFEVADVHEVLDLLAEARIDAFVLGGWGVDALVGEQTRHHKDLDIIVRDEDVSRMSDVLNEHGFLPSRGVQGGVELCDERGRVVDVHPVRFDDRGNGHFESEDRGPFEHPAAAFAATGSIAGRRVACLSAEAQMRNHAWGYTAGDTDFHDMTLLNERLGVEYPPPFTDAWPRGVVGPPREGAG